VLPSSSTSVGIFAERVLLPHAVLGIERVGILDPNLVLKTEDRDRDSDFRAKGEVVDERRTSIFDPPIHSL